MRVAFLASDKPREQLLADAFLRGAAAHGHETQSLRLGEKLDPGSAEVVCMVGVKSRELFQAHHHAGAHVLYLDKGYSREKSASPLRGWEYWRVAIDAHQPTDRLARQQSPEDRLVALGLEMRPWREKGEHILLAGSSAKYHEFYGLLEPTAYWAKVARSLLELTPRPIVYRPKPSWSEAKPIRKTRFSRPPEGIHEALAGAHAVITHGSNACFEAILAGIPVITLGPAVAKVISSHELTDVEAPWLASKTERRQWLANLAYWQWTQAEMASGAAWDFIGGQLHA